MQTLTVGLHGTTQYKENLDLRMKFGDQPLRYLDSEVDLVDTIKGLMQVRECSPNQCFSVAVVAAFHYTPRSVRHPTLLGQMWFLVYIYIAICLLHDS